MQPFTLPRAALEIAKFASQDDSRPKIQKVYIAPSEHDAALTDVVATNGHYLARMTVNHTTPNAGLIAASSLLTAAKVKGKHKVVSIGAYKISIYGAEGETSITALFDLGTEGFPEYRQVIPGPDQYEGPTRSEAVCVDFDHMADIAACLKSVKKLTRKSGNVLASMRFTVANPTLSPVRFSASSSILPDDVKSLDFILMPARM